MTPYKGKSIISRYSKQFICIVFYYLMTKSKTFALTGRHRDLFYTQGIALGYVLPLGFQPALFNALATQFAIRLNTYLLLQRYNKKY